MSVAPYCHADHVARHGEYPCPVNRWHIWRGTVQWFIVGPGANAMQACSKPVYIGRHPTIGAREAAVARVAIRNLSERHAQDKELGPEEIRTFIAQAELEVPAHITDASDPDDMGDLSDLMIDDEPELDLEAESA